MNLIAQALIIQLPVDFQFEAGTGVFVDSALHVNRTYALPDTRGQAWSQLELAPGTYDVTVEAWGQAGPAGWPTVSLALSADGVPQASITLDSDHPREYRTRMVFFAEQPHFYIRMLNDSYDPLTKKDTNAHILKVVFSTVAADSVVVSWDPNSETDLAGYRLYRGYASRDYGAVSTVKDTSAGLRLERGKKHFFAVTAFDSSGNESGYSDEVTYESPATPVMPKIVFLSPEDGRVFVDTATVVYEVVGDSSMVESHVVRIDDMTIEPMVKPPRRNRLQWSGLAQGRHDVWVVIYDAAGGKLDEAGLSFFVADTMAPGRVRNLKYRVIR